MPRVRSRPAELNVNASPPLKIDGMAGPRTLPTIFKIGLAKDANVSSYTAKAREKFNNRNSKSEQDIAEDIVETEINPRLQAEGIPPIKFKIVNGLGSRGAFSSAEWELKLDDLQFQPGNKHDLRDSTATMYHEARHAEQDFRVGQMLAGRKKTAEQINDERIRRRPTPPGRPKPKRGSTARSQSTTICRTSSTRNASRRRCGSSSERPAPAKADVSLWVGAFTLRGSPPLRGSSSGDNEISTKRRCSFGDNQNRGRGDPRAESSGLPLRGAWCFTPF